MAKSFLRWRFADRPPVASTVPVGAVIAQIRDEDLPEIARLMVDGYRGTIDFEGESHDDALEELRGAAVGGNGDPMRSAWLVARAPDGAPASALCVVRWRGTPFISYVFSAPQHKGRGYAGALITEAASRLARAGETELQLFVTVGNPARALYERIGFVEEPAPES